MDNMSPLFFIGNIRIGSVSGASCVNLGNNLPVGFQSYMRQNQGFGSITGDNNDISELYSILKDTNMIDMLNKSDTEDIPEWIRKLAAEKFFEGEKKSSKHSDSR